MSYTLMEVRAALADSMGSLVEGTATGGDLTTIVDTSGLAIYENAEDLARALAYIRSAGGAAPEGEARWVSGYAAATATLTVATAFSAAVQSGDGYELYLAPLSLGQWDGCINQAIREAWPELCELRMVEFAWMPPPYRIALTEDQRHIQSVMLGWAHVPGRMLRVPRSWWQVGYDGGWYLFLNQVVPEDREVVAFYRYPHQELSDADDETGLYLSYLLTAARAGVHALLAERSGAQAAAAQHLQLLNYWREQAREEKERLSILVEETRA